MIISDDRKHQEWQQMEVAPTGLPGLGFSYGENFRYHISPGEQHEISCSNVIGIHNCAYTASWKYAIDFFVIVFKPVGLYQLLRTDMGELKNNLTNFRLLGLKESEWICENLRKLPVNKHKITFIENWLEKKLAGTTPVAGITREFAQKIIERKGAVVIGDLSGELHVNRKYLERHFNLELGLSPKEFADIIRFNYVDMLLQRETVSWKELTYLGKFHDQSHLIKHFNKITGLTPSAFKQLSDHRPEAKFIKKHNVYDLILNSSPVPIS